MQYRTILCAIKAAIILCKTLCNIVKYVNKNFKSFLIILLCKNLCNILWKKSATLAVLAIQKIIALYLMMIFIVEVTPVW